MKSKSVLNHDPSTCPDLSPSKYKISEMKDHPSKVPNFGAKEKKSPWLWRFVGRNLREMKFVWRRRESVRKIFRKRRKRSCSWGRWCRVVLAGMGLYTRSLASNGFNQSCRRVSMETHKPMYTILLYLGSIDPNKKPSRSPRVTDGGKKVASFLKDGGLNIQGCLSPLGIFMFLTCGFICLLCTARNTNHSWSLNKTVKGACDHLPPTSRKGSQNLGKKQIPEGLANPIDGGDTSFAVSAKEPSTLKHVAIQGGRKNTGL